MALPQKAEQLFTYHDYLTWQDDQRWEIIDGVAYAMSPAPKIKHQNIVGNFYLQIKTHPNNPCYTGIAPTDVVFDAYNVVQPDVFVVCDKKKITEDNIQGAPDLIIEVTSPSTLLKDKREKKNLYERCRVKEYIIVYPEGDIIERFYLKGDKYTTPEVFNWDETLKLYTLNIEIKLWEVFEKKPSVSKTASEG